MFNAMTAQVAEALRAPADELNTRLDRIATLLERLLVVESAKLTAAQARTLPDVQAGVEAAGQ
jgi:hypothetical protein